MSQFIVPTFQLHNPLAIREHLGRPQMNRKKSNHGGSRWAGLAMLAMAACSQPPSELVTQAQETEQRAIASGALEYAPDAVSDVATARAALEAELAVQGERWSVRRSYDEAETLAEAYRLASDRAAAEANAARDGVRSAAETLITETELLIADVRDMLVVAPVGKGSAADLAALRGDLDAAEAGLDAARASMTTQDYLDAQASALAARGITDGVRAAVQQARGARVG